MQAKLGCGSITNMGGRSRAALAAPPAAAVAVALLAAMIVAIDVPEIDLAPKPQRVLTRITPQIEPVEPTSFDPAKPLKPFQPPPSVPKFQPGNTNASVPLGEIVGGPPSELGVSDLAFVVPDVPAITDRGVRPLRPPEVVYPERALRDGVTGSCEVFLDVDARGRPFNVRAACTRAVFEREAVRAVSRVEFAPKIVRSRAVSRTGVVYPLEFELK